MPDPPQAQPPFEFPSPTKQNRSMWQRQVTEALVAGGLGWSHITDTQWILEGNCPRCGHPITNYVDLDVIAARTFGVDTFKADEDSLITEVVCTCDVTPAHRKDTKGCGWGSGLEIELPLPKPREV